MHKFWNDITKGNTKKFLYNNLLVIVGALLLAFGTAIFLTNLQIVSGGLSGLAIIIQSYFPETQIVDIVVWCGSVVFLILSYFIQGKAFALKTLVFSIVYPLFLTLFLRVPFFIDFSKKVAGNGEVGNILLCAIFAGVINGAGIAIAFLGEGSTGGFDVLIFLFSKITKFKESFWSFVIDAVIIILSMFLIKDNVINSLCGIIVAFVTALLIEFIYISSHNSLQVDIISDKWEDINVFAHETLDRSATIISAVGGYSKQEKHMLRIVIDKKQFDELRRYIATIDPNAFVTYTQTKAVFGLGFKKHTKR